MKFTEYFLEENSFMFMDYIRAGEAPWDALRSIPEIITRFIDGKSDTGINLPDGLIRLETIHRGNSEEISVTVNRPVVLERELTLKNIGIYMSEGVFLEPGAIIKAPAFIGAGSEIRQGAYMRGNVIISAGCVVGHVTEVKNSIFMDKSNAGHFAYVGDSILGSRVNLGAGAILANLQFRSRREIDEDSINEIMIKGDDGDIPTGRDKLGAVIGDYSEIGCNTVTAPGTCVGHGCWIYPNTAAPKGFYKPGSILKNPGGASIEIKSRPTG